MCKRQNKSEKLIFFNYQPDPQTRYFDFENKLGQVGKKFTGSGPVPGTRLTL